MPIGLLVDSLATSVLVGSLYALMAVGLTLTMAVVKLPNFAHAELISTGAYAALIVSLALGGGALAGNPIVVLVGAFVAAALVALLAHWMVFRPLSRRKSSTYVLILASFAVGLIIRYLLFLLADSFDLFDKRIQVAQEIWLQAGPLTLTNIFFWVVPISIGLVAALSLLLNFTNLGRQMRALADNATLARVVGVPTERVVNLTWVLVGGLAGVGGALWGIYTFVDPLLRLAGHSLGLCRRRARWTDQFFRRHPGRLRRRLCREHVDAAAQLLVRSRLQLQAGYPLYHHHSGADDSPPGSDRPLRRPAPRHRTGAVGV